MQKILLIILTLSSSIFMKGQDLNGKWLIKDVKVENGRRDYPGFMLIEINDTIADLFSDFSLENKTNLKLKGNDMNYSHNDELFAKYEIADKNHLKLFLKGTSNSKRALFEFDFYKLQPTFTNLKKSDIEKLSFTINMNERETDLIFTKYPLSEENLKLMESNFKVFHVIEQIDSTFFLSMYSRGKRDGSIPIKEVNEKFLKLYALPTTEMELTAYLKK